MCDALLFDFYVSNILLGESKPFPNKSSGSKPEELIQHIMVGADYDEAKVRTKKSFWKDW